MSCADIDECAQGDYECHWNAKCINTIGSYRCSCLNGYHGNGKQCKGIEVIPFNYVNLYINRDKAYGALRSATKIANIDYLFLRVKDFSKTRLARHLVYTQYNYKSAR